MFSVKLFKIHIDINGQTDRYRLINEVSQNKPRKYILRIDPTSTQEAK